ncbi:uncharacterized protein LOC109610147 [Camponotus floridanus]|uniref:uncharacterized protein LOC109610147 n=1 Tax=Camponotus floridanus TaxID=104421 RepID=UPI000DC6875F|nr:uncharacterized protein LOC109610147 [Camponotus floridanus]
MWKNIRDSWNLLKDEAERDIMRQYSSHGELHTILITLSVIGTLLLYAFFEFMPTILDVIFPLNETRAHELHALTEYFVDEEKYFYIILCHWLIGTYFEGFVCIATYTLQLAYIHHICGLLKIASYRIEHSLDTYILYNSIQEDHTAIQNICAAVNIHRRALECSEFFMVTFAPTFFIIIVISVASLSFNLFRVSYSP